MCVVKMMTSVHEQCTYTRQNSSAHVSIYPSLEFIFINGIFIVEWSRNVCMLFACIIFSLSKSSTSHATKQAWCKGKKGEAEEATR